MAKSPYEILGISESATEAEVKKAFRNLAKIYHTDNQSTGNNEKVKDIIQAYDKIMKIINSKKRDSLSVEDLIERETDKFKSYPNYENLKDTVEQIKNKYKNVIDANKDRKDMLIDAMLERLEDLFKEYKRSRQEMSIDELLQNETLRYELEDDYEQLKESITSLVNNYKKSIEAYMDKKDLLISAMHERIIEMFEEYRRTYQNSTADELINKETLKYELEDDYENIKEFIEQIKEQYKKFIETNPERKVSFVSAMHEKIEYLFKEYQKRLETYNELLSIDLDPRDQELLESIKDSIISNDELLENLYNKYKTPDKSMQDDTPHGPTL